MHAMGSGPAVRKRWMGWWAAPVLVVVLVAMGGTAAADGPGVRASAKTGARSGSLVIRVTGLPRGQRGSVQLRRDGTRKRVVNGRARTFRRLRRGTYRVVARPVRIGTPRGGLQRGAVIYPTVTVTKVRVRGERRRIVTVRYGTVVNPGVTALRGAVLEVGGPPENPTTVAVFARSTPEVGTILAATPRDALPAGLLHRVTAKSVEGKVTTLQLEPAPVSDALPSLVFRGRASEPAGTLRSLRAAPHAWTLGPDCDFGGGGFFRLWAGLDEPWLDLDVNVLPWKPIRAKTVVSLGAHLGYEGLSNQHFACEVPTQLLLSRPIFIPVPVVGLLPVYFQVPLTGRVEWSGEGRSRRDMTWRVTFGQETEVRGGTPNVRPVFDFESSNVSASGREPLFDASVTLSAEFGIGLPALANINVQAGLGARFRNRPERCGIDGFVDGFKLEGNLARFKLATPSLPGFSKELWECPRNPAAGLPGDCEGTTTTNRAFRECRSTILRDPKTGASYLVDTAGVPHWIRDGSTYNCLRTRFRLYSVPQAAINGLGSGQPWQPTCGSIATVSATGTSYVIDAGATSHWIADGETYLCLTGRGTAVASELSQAHLDTFGNGRPWAPRCLSPGRVSGKIVRVASTGTSYFVDNHGSPHWIRSAAIYNCLTARGIPVVDGLEQQHVDSIGNGQPWQPPCNSIATVSATGTSFFIDGAGRPHWIADAETYHCLTGRGKSVEGNIPQSLIDALGNGQPWQPRCLDPGRARGKILSVKNGPSYTYDGTLHWIPDVETYHCWRSPPRSYEVMSGLTQEHVDSLGNGQPWAAECIYPPRVRRHVVREKGGTAYFVDGNDLWHWIPDGGTYNCLVAKYPLTNNVTWGEINSIKREGAHANCAM